MHSPTQLLTEFSRVSRAVPCPICRKPDWCLVCSKNPEDPERVICSRTESTRKWGDAGWLHQLKQADRKPRAFSQRVVTIPAQRSSKRMADLAINFESRVDSAALRSLSSSLGVSVASLHSLRIGWTRSAWSFPMSTGMGEVVGIRLRRPNGEKLAVPGSKNGIFIPVQVDFTGCLVVCEGPTDAAALLDRGYFAVGRPSCNGGANELARYVRQLRPSSLVIVADNDMPGRRGADTLAAVLLPLSPAVKVVVPPDDVADAREWMQLESAGEEFSAAVREAPVRTASFRIVPEVRIA